jgi:hypothetical protein
MSKKIEEKAIRRFKRLTFACGLVVIPICLHKLLCVYKPKWARRYRNNNLVYTLIE